MLNSIRNISKICVNQLNINKSSLPVFAVMNRTYADHSKASHLYTTFMNSGPDLRTKHDDDRKSHWLEYNDKVFSPQDPSEERRPAYVCHQLINVKYSPKKMWYVSAFIRGLSVDEALRQLTFIRYKGSAIAKQLIEEAIEMAVNEHNVEFRTNLWIAESFCTKGLVVKGVRRHAKGRIGMISYRYVNCYIRLEEGEPPADYLQRGDRSGPALLKKWLAEMRSRKIINSL